jgi:hypothetical protein
VPLPIALGGDDYLPKLGRRLTRLLNWVLLPALPVGTILSLYGFWKVDCDNKD